MDDEAPFSESMLEWLEEGDRMSDAPPGSGPRPSAAYHTTEASGRRSKIVIGGVVLLAGVFVLALRLSGSGKPKAEEQAAAETPPPATAVVAAPPPAVAEQAVADPAAPVAADPAAAPAAVAASTAIAADPAAVAAAPTEVPAPAAAALAAPAPQAVAAQPVGVPQPAAVRGMQPTPPPAATPAPAPVAAAPAPVPVAQTRPTVALAAELQRPSARPVAAPIAAALDVADTGAYGAALAQCRAFMTAGQIKHAVTACRQATEAKPGAAEALTLLAEAEFTRGHTGLALRLATEAAASDQNFAEAYVVIGGIYQDKGKSAEARAAYEQYLALEPKGKHAADLRAILAAL